MQRKTNLQSRAARAAFTLVELLVVITIIVILISLLAPAMDAAIYQAELAKCAAQQRGVGGGATAYAMDQKRMYPSAPGGRGFHYSPDVLGMTNDPTHDLRPIVVQFIGLTAFNCPLTEKVDLDAQSNTADTIVYGNYDLWFGWKYTVNGSHAAMRKIGDRFSYTPTGGQMSQFSILSSDLNIYDDVSPFSQNSHPDHEGLQAQEVYRNVFIGMPGNVGVAAINQPKTFSRWTGFVRRSETDINYSSADGSVRPMRNVPKGPSDELRMVPVPAANDVEAKPSDIYIPAE